MRLKVLTPNQDRKAKIDIIRNYEHAHITFPESQGHSSLVQRLSIVSILNYVVWSQSHGNGSSNTV